MTAGPFSRRATDGDERFDPANHPSGPEREPGHAALRALRCAENDALIAVMLRPSFKPIDRHDLVVVAPCPHCLDGGLRTAGSVRTRTGREAVRACDTCHTVEVGPLGHAQVVRLPDTRRQA